MTVSGQRVCVENVAASEPTHGQRTAAKITAKTPLPPGWASFCSKPDSSTQAHWYATAPWNVLSLKEKYGPNAEYLAQMVNAETWVDLHKAVAAQVRLYEEVVSSSSRK